MNMGMARDKRYHRGYQSGRAMLQYLLLGAFMVLVLLPGVPAELSADCDTTRDLLLARACQTEEVCAMRGSDTTVPGVAFSGLWPIHLAFLGEMGLAVDGSYRLGVGLLVAGLLLLTLAAEAIAGRTVGFALGLLGVLAHTKMAYWLYLWNPSTVLLPSVAFFCSLVVVVHSRHWGAYAAASLFLALAMALHPVAVLLALSLPWVFVLHPPRRPVASVLAALVAVVTPFYAFSRDAVVVLVREVATGALAGGIEKESQSLPGWETIGVALVLLISLLGLIWFRRQRDDMLGTLLKSPTTALLAGCLAPAVLSLYILAVANRMWVDRYMVFMLPGALLAVAVVARAASRRCPWSLPISDGPRRWLGPLLPLLVAALVSGFLLDGAKPLPKTWSYRDGDAAARNLRDRGIGDFGTALAATVAPGIRPFFTALRPYLAGERASSSATYDGPGVLFAATRVDQESIPEEWRVRTRPDGSVLVAIPVANLTEPSSGQVRLSKQGDRDTPPFVPAVPSGLLATAQPWLQTGDGALADTGNLLQMSIRVQPVVGSFRFRALSDCRCPGSLARVIRVDGADAFHTEDGGVVIELVGQPGVEVVGEWTYPAPCRPLEGKHASPIIVAWPSHETDIAIVLEGQVCP